MPGRWSTAFSLGTLLGTVDFKRALGPCLHECSFLCKIPHTGTVSLTLQSISVYTFSLDAQNDLPEIDMKVLTSKGEIRQQFRKDKSLAF